VFLANHVADQRSFVPYTCSVFNFIFLWSVWLSSTLPRLVYLAHVRSFYFLFCCFELSSVVLHCGAIHCVASAVLHCVALSWDPLCCVALCCLQVQHF